MSNSNFITFITMNFLKKIKFFSTANEQKCIPDTAASTHIAQKQLLHQNHSNSFQLIMLDILDQKNRDGEKQEKSEQIYQDLVFEEDEDQGIQNIYLKDFIFINKLSQPKQLSISQWNELISSKNLSLFPKKNIYFSILKGIKFEVRKKAWELFANTEEMKKMTSRPYKDLVNSQYLSEDIVKQIDKDVPRSKSVTEYTKQLRNVLVAYCVLTKKEYTQGMNLIAGSLLTLLALQNDEQLEKFGIFEKQFQQRVFWIFIGIMVWKNWQKIFDKNFTGLSQSLKRLQELMVEHVPDVYQTLINFEWDLTIFSQYYITIMLYNTPRDFSKIILDLFLVDGQNAIHSLIIRMMKLQEHKILKIDDECLLMNYFKKQIINDCYMSIKKNQPHAKKLEDFEMNFMKSLK